MTNYQDNEVIKQMYEGDEITHYQHQESENEEYFECINEYFDGMCEV